MYSTANGTVHYKEPLKSFGIRAGHSPGFGLPSVAILPWLCRKRRRAIFIHSVSHSHTISGFDVVTALDQRWRRWANNVSSLLGD